MGAYVQPPLQPPDDLPIGYRAEHPTRQVDTPKPAATADVMREQLEFLIEHGAECGDYDCPLCLRYRLMQRILLCAFE